MDRSFLDRTLKLANLAPDIIKFIRENKQPPSLTLNKLRNGIPESREKQRKLFLSRGHWFAEIKNWQYRVLQT